MKKNVWTKALSMLLALVMVVGMIPTTAVAVLADGVPESLVTSLAGLYDGDEARAREELEALRDAGIIDENGNLAALDICEDGERVELSALAQRIASGELTQDSHLRTCLWLLAFLVFGYALSSVLRALILKFFYNIEGERKEQMYRELEEMRAKRHEENEAIEAAAEN